MSSQEWCKKVAVMTGSFYNYLVLVNVLLILLMSSPTFAAKKKDFWYKVESPEEKKEEPPAEPQHQFDSIESEANSRIHRGVRFWTLKPKFSLGGGLKYDKGFADDEYGDFMVLNTDFTFKDRGWNRLMLGGVFTFHSNFMVHFMWQFTPTRKQLRLFYGFGLGLNWDPGDEVRTLIEMESYQVIGNVGYEWLMRGHQGLRFELRGFAATEDFGIMLLTSYIWHL